MKKYLMGLLLLLASGGANAVFVTVIDDFEGYADSAALQAAWVVNPNSNITSETLESVLSGKCMLLQNNQSSPYYAQTKYALPGAIWQSHGVNFDLSGVFHD